MIYLIGGAPRTGKTTLGASLAKVKAIPYFSFDHITSVIYPYIPKNKYIDKFPLGNALKESKFSNDTFYMKYSAEEAVELYFRQAETCWPGIKNFINYALTDEHDLILEGWQIIPYFINQIINQKNKDYLKIIFLCKNNIKDIIRGIKEDKSKHNWVVNNTKNPETYLSIANMISYFSKRIKQDADTFHFQTTNMEFKFKNIMADLEKYF